MYAEPKDLTEKARQYDEESDAYTDVECNTETHIKQRVKKCWVRGRADELPYDIKNYGAPVATRRPVDSSGRPWQTSTPVQERLPT